MSRGQPPTQYASDEAGDNNNMSRRLNVLQHNRKRLEEVLQQLHQKAHRLNDVEGRQLLVDISERDNRIERLEADLERMLQNAFLEEFRTKQYRRMLEFSTV